MAFFLSRLRPVASAYIRLLTSYAVAPRGKINISMPCKLARIIPMMSDDQMLVRLIDHDGYQVDQVLQVDVEKNNTNHRSDIKINSKPELMQDLRNKLQFELQVPMHYDLDINLEDGDVQIENLESRAIKINLLNGSCVTKSLKSTNLEIECKYGSITNHSYVLGDYIAICRSSGAIFANKLQGSTISLTTDKGNVAVESVYCKSMDCKSEMGLIRLGSCHGHMNVTTSLANIDIDSLSGSAEIASRDGSISIHVDAHAIGNVDLQTTEGNIDITVPSNLGVSAHFIASHLELDRKLSLSNSVCTNDSYNGTIGNRSSQTTSSVLNAFARNGTLAVRVKEWFDVLKFKNP
ncbi:Protein FAM185A [Trichoplax sp. H2]|nr:Protein FAM185A [Trichoplax sp. H2]|eukprot:RDD44618.1 Protein FAM185A [Trichoplax sp. H2]